ncbi:MAG: DUF2384 domain-containing protein [Methylococcaceae bacterium]|nr:DUF2384 domain-containing protein [Methylococcaceae bacterium]
MNAIFAKNVGTLELLDSIQKGLAFSLFEEVVKHYQFTMTDLAAVVGMSPRTLARRKIEKKLSQSESDRLVSVVRLLTQSAELFEEDLEKANHWLNTPNRGLGGHTPWQIAQTETGSREVEQLIGRLENGVFS